MTCINALLYNYRHEYTSKERHMQNLFVIKLIHTASSSVPLLRHMNTTNKDL